MVEHELTSMGESRYHGYMEPTGAEHTLGQGEDQPSRALDDKGLYQRAKKGIETDVAPPQSEVDPYREAVEKLKTEKRYTREQLVEIAQTIHSKPNVSDVYTDAKFVSSAAKILQRNIEADVANFGVNKDILDQLKKPGGILDEAAKVSKFIENYRPDGQTQKEEDSPERRRAIFSHVNRIADLAERVSGYYEKAKISKERDDPFRQIVSFEELMTKFESTMEDPKFLPGGEFSLLDVYEYVDEFGREMSAEDAHPENFLRWVQEKAEFYHDFDPMAQIDLFQGMYLIAGTRKVGMYEILVDFDAYFAHRRPTKGELKVLREDILRAKDKGYFVSVGKENPETGEVSYSSEEEEEKREGAVGYYKKFVDPETGKQTKAFVRLTGVYKEGTNSPLYEVYYRDKDGNKKPVEAVIENKEEWQTGQDTGFEEMREEIMYQIWLLTKSHNGDVNYRQKGMVNEKPLSETLAEIYSDNIMTRTRKRLLKMFNMPSTTYREERIFDGVDENGQIKWKNSHNEAREKMEGKLNNQGSTGKAFQRSLAAYYHIAEANAAFEGYKIEGSNPFFEILRKGDIDGAEIFYKSLITRCLFDDAKFGYVENGYNPDKNPDKCKIDVEFFNILNGIRIPKPDGTSRKRFEWEKADFVDFMTLSRDDFLRKMEGRNITSATLDETFKILEGKYSDGHTRRQAVEELKSNITQFSNARRKEFVNSLVGKSGISEDDKKKEGVKDKDGKTLEKDGFLSRFLNSDTDDPMKGLDLFAVGLFTKSFPPEFSPDINPYSNIRYSLEARERMRNAMRDTLMYTEKLDAFDAKYAEEWAYTMTFYTGISARNDVQGIGHDPWSKIQNTEYYRLRQTGGGNYPGNLDNLYGIHRLGVNFWEGLKVQPDGDKDYTKTLYEELTGLRKDGDNYYFDINKNMESYEFAGNAMRQFYADHVSHVVDLFIDITQKQEFNLTDLLKHDNFQRLTWNNEAMQKMIDSTWKHLRYGFDNNGIMYDKDVFGWGYDEKLKPNGQVSRTPHFGIKSIRELMFSEKVRSMDMYERDDVSSWAPTKSNKSTKMARNVFAYLIAAQLREHTRWGGGYKIYSAEEVETITEAFLMYAARVMRGGDTETLVLSGFFNPEEMVRILVAGHSILWWLYLKENAISSTSSLLFGMLEALALIMKQAGAGIKL